jgi:hypothetical protein
MTVELIGAITFIFGLIGLFVEPSFLVYSFFGATLLGAAAAVILDSLGGTTVQPAHLMLGFLTLRLLNVRDIRTGMLRAVAFGSPGFWLIVTVGYAAITAYLLPRLFQGQTLAFPVRAEGGRYYAAALVPTTSNFTQSVYFTADCICFLLLSSFGRSDKGRVCLERAALVCVVLNLVFVVLDLVTYATNTSELLSYIRNSTYSVLQVDEVAGFKRIVGSFVEASSFGYWTVGYFAFATSLWLEGIATRLTLSLSVLSFTALVFSTSTTGYVGLLGYLFVQFFVIAFKFLFRSIRPQMIIFLICLPAVFGLIAILICLNDESYAYVGNLLNTMLLNKMSTSSGIERSQWNSQAIQNVIDTFGFGTGNGSTRASSFPVALIASLGVPGAFTYAMFLLGIWRKARATGPSTALAMQAAARSACLGWLIAATASGGGVDLGLPFFAFAALACAPLPESRTHLAGGRKYLRSFSSAEANV